MKISRTVFVGSTFKDLELHRRALIDALHDLAWLSVMESRGAATGSVIDNCRRWVQNSDVYVGVVGMCYGSRVPGSPLSFTEFEYDEAMRLKLPCLVYLIDEDRHPLPPSSVDRGTDAEALANFKQKVLEANHRGLFRSPEHLQYQVTRDIIRLFDDLGWLQAPANAQAAATPATQEDPWRVQLCAWNSNLGALVLNELPNEEEKVEMAAAVLISRFTAGDFASLRGVISFRPEIWNALRFFLAVRDVNEGALGDEIANARDVFYVRLLVDVAGLAGAKSCVEPICKQMLRRGHQFDKEIGALGYQIRSFLEVAAEALGRMPQSSKATIANYLEQARAGQKWQAKEKFEKALRTLASRSQDDQPTHN